ncbi:MAG: pilus assembly protein TadG-related protein [Beijerinckiaceae bacterium]|nr:pilus assembly protein TadG-related protein [Beijerinckiaceae bacterium]
MLIFGLSFLPVMILVGSAFDYSQASKRKSEIQNALDSAVLATTQQARTMTSAQLAAFANAQFQANMGRDTTAVLSGAPSVSADFRTVCITARDDSVNAVMGLVARPITAVAATACAKTQNNFYEIAMVLDNSGSMNNSAGGKTKLQALQDAAKAMVSAMNPAGLPQPQAAFSIVPFGAAVNIGSSYANANFVDKLGKSSIHWQNFQRPSSASWTPASKFDLFTGMSTTWGGCVEERPAPYTTTDTVASPSVPDTLFVPMLYPDETDSSTYVFNNYLSDSGGSCKNNDDYKKADTPGDALNIGSVGTGDGQTKVCKYKGQTPVSASIPSLGTGWLTGPNLLCSTKPIQQLSTDMTVVNATIQNSLVAQGDTNTMAGLMWGWRTISPNGPFNVHGNSSVGYQDARAYGAKTSDGRDVIKVVVLMSDGKNNWASSSANPNNGVYNSFGFMKNKRLGATTTSGNSRSLMDAKTLEACTNMKNAGIQIYTVGFSTATDPIDSTGLSVLRSCASNADSAFTAGDGSQIVSAFQEIAKAMTKLRISN